MRLAPPELSRPLRVLVALLLACAVPCAQDTWENWPDTTPGLDAVDAQLSRAREAASNVDASAGADSVGAATQTALLRRATLLEELRAILVRRAQLEERLENRAELEMQATLELERWNSTPPAPVVVATQDSVTALEAELEARRAEVQGIRSTIEAANGRSDTHGERRAAADARGRAAEQREAELADPNGPSQTLDPTLRQLRIANARLDARIAGLDSDLLDRELHADGPLGQLRSLNAELAELRRARAEEQLERARTVLAESSAAARRQLEQQLALSEQSAAAEQDEEARFLAESEVAALRARTRTAELDATLLQLGRSTDEQGARLEADEQELERLRREVANFGVDGRVGERLRDVFQGLEPKRRAVELAVPPTLRASTDEWRSRRFEVDETLFELAGRWRSDVDALAARLGLTDDEREALRARSGPRREALRDALEGERAALTAVIARTDRLRGIQVERRAVLRELETFVHAKVFWIRDGPRLDLETLRGLPPEARELGAYASGLASAESLDELRALTRSPGALVRALSVLLALPVLWLASARIRRRLRATQGSDAPAWKSGWRTLVVAVFALGNALLLPAFLVVFGRALAEVELPGDLGPVLGLAARRSAPFVLLLSVGRVALRRSAELEGSSRIPTDTRVALQRAVRAVGLAGAILMPTRAVLGAEPFGFDAAPLILLIGFLLVLATRACGLFHAGSPLVRDVLGRRHESALRWRAFWNAALGVLTFGIPLLTGLGFSFAATVLGTNVGLTLVTFALLPAASRLVLEGLDRATSGGSSASSEPDSDESPEALVTRRRELSKLVRAAFVVGGALLLASIWGIDQQGWGVLEGARLWRANSPAAEVAEFVTVADGILAVVSLVVLVWLLRNLPGIYDLALFPRLRLDSGVRYAIVTISRYGLFFVGCLVALSFIHLDLSRLGWLVAAMGVGLGFGLQEIVSNFVSGIILLVERPIRVGDLVTVGNVSGRVQRINIRATTVVNFDRLEVIVPNRSLITQEVTNWTLADEMTRLIVPIGVAYGSDVETVRAVLTRIAREQPEVLADPEPQVVFVRHGESSLDFEIRCFLGRTADRVPLQDRLNALINREFAAHDIEIPFPQRDLHLRTDELIPRVAPEPAGDSADPRTASREPQP